MLESTLVRDATRFFETSFKLSVPAEGITRMKLKKMYSRHWDALMTHSRLLSIRGNIEGIPRFKELRRIWPVLIQVFEDENLPMDYLQRFEDANAEGIQDKYAKWTFKEVYDYLCFNDKSQLRSTVFFIIWMDLRTTYLSRFNNMQKHDRLEYLRKQRDPDGLGLELRDLTKEMNKLERLMAPALEQLQKYEQRVKGLKESLRMNAFEQLRIQAILSNLPPESRELILGEVNRFPGRALKVRQDFGDLMDL